MSGPDDGLSAVDAGDDTDPTSMAEATSEINLQSCGGSSKTCWLGMGEKDHRMH
jgi:hypothetical protein